MTGSAAWSDDRLHRLWAFKGQQIHVITDAGDTACDTIEEAEREVDRSSGASPDLDTPSPTSSE